MPVPCVRTAIRCQSIWNRPCSLCAKPGTVSPPPCIARPSATIGQSVGVLLRSFCDSVPCSERRRWPSVSGLFSHSKTPFARQSCPVFPLLGGCFLIGELELSGRVEVFTQSQVLFTLFQLLSGTTTCQQEQHGRQSELAISHLHRDDNVQNLLSIVLVTVICYGDPSIAVVAQNVVDNLRNLGFQLVDELCGIVFPVLYVA